MKPILLNISKEVQLPIDAVTQKFSFIGRSGSGKTHGAGKLAEEFLTHKIQVVVLDPVGVWNGLRTSANGKERGFAIPVFGGDKGDVPLLPTSGALIANVIVEKQIPAVLDVSQFRKNERKQFITDFAETLFHLKKKHRSPMHLVVEEAQMFIPQKTYAGEERMLGAMEDIVKLGRNYGIGITLITQRPQAVHKDCLNQTEALFVFQTNGPHERKAIEDWIVDKGLAKSTVGSDMAGLEVGTCFLWSPQWLRILKKVKILPKVTFDASQTPKIGQSNVTRNLAPIDLKKIEADIQSVIEQKKETDPAELRKQILELKRELNKKAGMNRTPVDAAQMEKIAAENTNLKLKLSYLRNQLEELKKMIELHFQEKQKEMLNLLKQFHNNISDVIATEYNKKSGLETIHREAHKPHITGTTATRQPQPGKVIYSTSATGVNIGRCERAILIALAQREKISTKQQIGILSGYSSGSGSFNNSISKLRTSGYITGTGDNLTITAEGLNALGTYEKLPIGEALHRYWLNKLGKCEASILKVLIGAYPDALEKQTIGELTGYSPNSGSFNNAVSKLNTLELIEKTGYGIKASSSLFEF